MIKKATILILLIGYSVILFAQGSTTEYVPVQVDLITKVVGIFMTIGGLYLGYSNMRTANKMAVLEATLTKTISDVKDEFKKELTLEIRAIETKMELHNKELANDMVTKRDLDYLNKNIQLQYEIIKGQLRSAAETYKKDNG